jgi:heterodisulfide reductase subunit B
MKVTYYPGCSLESSARDYDESIKAVCRALDIQLQEPDNWTCCGATSAHSLSGKLAIDLPARNLPVAERLGQDMLVPCPLCYNRLIRAKEKTGSAVPIHDMASLCPAGHAEKSDRGFGPLTGISAVCYYGCMANHAQNHREYKL